MAALQANGITSQSSPYPLAIAQMDGTIRQCRKSLFRDALLSHDEFKQAFIHTCPLYTQPSNDLCVIIDFLYFIHIPPPVDVITYYQYANHLWECSVKKYGLKNGAKYIYIVVDKPAFLPPPRALVHRTRSEATQGTMYTVDPEIRNDLPVVHGSRYISLLANSKTFKEKFIKYLSTQMLRNALTVTSNESVKIIMDTPSFTQPAMIKDGSVERHPSNQHGEADYAIWHHASQCEARHILVFSSDTDTWVYGLAIKERGYLGHKNVYVQQGNTGGFVNINQLVESIISHPRLQTIQNPVSHIVALYTLSGCDYVSMFYGCSKKKFLNEFISNVNHICMPEPLIEFDDERFQTINFRSWIRLICAVYFSKYNTFFRRQPLTTVYSSMLQHSDIKENQQLLSWVGYPEGQTIATLNDWHSFIQRVTYHVSKVTHHHESKLLPSWEALENHCRRAEYVLKLVYSVKNTHCPHISQDNCAAHGWKVDGDEISVLWENGRSVQSSHHSKCSCSGIGHCRTNRCSCFRESKLCSGRCCCRDCSNTQLSNIHEDSDHDDTDSESSDMDDGCNIITSTECFNELDTYSLM